VKASRTLALYVHMPWCVRKCPYCDFNSHRAPNVLPVDQYIDALLADLDYDLSEHALAQRELVSIFMGGGTPSLFNPSAMDRLLVGIRERMSCPADMEVTMEANPGTIERASFRDYRSVGINRVSLGVQSFDDAALARLGRIHQSAEVLRAVEELHAAGLENFNVDLMYALPEQSLAGAIRDVESAIALRPAHISHYELTLEPGTVFYSRPPPLPDADLAWEMQLECQARLAAAGFEQYEVSAYGRAGRQCRHNLVYWTFGDYLGIGAGAHGKLTYPEELVRSVREKHPSRYLGSAPEQRCSWTEVDAELRVFEFMLNALRLVNGFCAAELESTTGATVEGIGHPLREAVCKGLLECVGGRWRATDLGRRFLNDLQGLFLPEDCDRSVASA
jgi:putative oxygen-independent coproporphyrinogen III oxidase